MGEENYEQIVYSRNVLEFVTVCNEYCSYIEQVDSHGKRDMVVTLAKVLPLLYLKTTMLPVIEDVLEDVPEKFVSEIDYHFLEGKIQVKLGEHNDYQEVFDPYIQFSERPVAGSIAENVMDIYQDVKDFLMAYRMGTVELMNDALYECQHNFGQYWGQRLVNCMRALHHLVYGDVDLDENVESRPSGKKRDQNEASDKILRNHFNHFSDESGEEL